MVLKHLHGAALLAGLVAAATGTGLAVALLQKPSPPPPPAPRYQVKPEDLIPMDRLLRGIPQGVPLEVRKPWLFPQKTTPLPRPKPMQPKRWPGRILEA